ncbi:MAG: glycosyltransferase [Candidatus Pacearchaeota archaeon]
MNKTSRKLIGINKESRVLLSVGRLIKRKGQERVIRLIPQLKKKFPGIKYLIVGNGPELKNINNLIGELNLKGEVLIFNNIEDKDLNIFYSACDLFILPCEFIPPNDVEGFGIVFIEANSFKKPCIGGFSGGVVEAILDKKTGLLINPKSSKDLLKKITLLLKNKKLMDKLGKTGFKRVSSVFNCSKNSILINELETIRGDRPHH